MTDFMFHLFALYQWETDGGSVFDDADESSLALAKSNSPEIFSRTVAPGTLACLNYRADQHRYPRGQAMTQHISTEAKDIMIHAFHTDAQCEYSGKTGEAVEVSTSDGTIQHAVVCIPELTKLLRFRHRQNEKQNGNGKPAT